jgi:NTP pyrophosphatase (non-canonical NTP hydrolase)
VSRAGGGEVTDSATEGGSTQQLVRATMAGVGGYWRPLAAVARLLEELGELAELLGEPTPDREELASELADVWIITTALSDQFLGAVAEPDSLEEPGSLEDPDSNGTPTDQLGALVACAGQIARIVNYYDGPKTPRSLEGWPSLSDAVAELHRALVRLARTHRVDLGIAVAGKLRAIAVRDSRRFARAEHDPSTAPCLKLFRAAATDAWGAQIEAARLWGAPAWSAQPLAANVAAIVPTLGSFTRAAPRERLEGYVVSGPTLDSEQASDEWARAVLSELTIAFNGVPLSASVLSAPQPHILLQFGNDERAHDRRHRAR